jgi:nucleoside-diphosphate-sugar epimerase
MNILVTGGGGYIGSVLVPALLAKGHAVTVLDNFMYGQNSLMDCCKDTNFSVVRGDCRDQSVLEPLLKSADIIIPLAALVGAPLCDRDMVGARTINLDAIKLLLELRSPLQAVIFPNTNSGYGVGEKEQYCTEDSPLKPITLYGRLKVEAEQTILDAGNAITFRLATVFGTSPRMRIDLLVNDFVYRAVNDRTVVVFEGHFKRNYVHIRDVARGFIHGIDNFEAMKGRPYNMGLNHANLSKLELCANIREHLPEFVYMEAPIGQDPDKRDYIVSNDRLLEAGFEPQFSLDDGIRELIKGYSILNNSRYSNI